MRDVQAHKVFCTFYVVEFSSEQAEAIAPLNYSLEIQKKQTQNTICQWLIEQTFIWLIKFGFS